MSLTPAELGSIESFRPVAETFQVGDVVRLTEYVGTVAQQKQIWRVTAVPTPTARKKNDREYYSVEPVGGGRGMYVYGYAITAGSDADKAKAARTPSVDRFLPGTAVTVRGARGVSLDTKCVVLAENTDGTVKVAVLNGDGRVWSKMPLANLRRTDI